jgi:hypothetical protein
VKGGEYDGSAICIASVAGGLLLFQIHGKSGLELIGKRSLAVRQRHGTWVAFTSSIPRAPLVK